MMKKSVLHFVADDRLGVFKDNEEAQFEMLLSLISDYHIDEEITIAEKHPKIKKPFPHQRKKTEKHLNHVCYPPPFFSSSSSIIIS